MVLTSVVRADDSAFITTLNIASKTIKVVPSPQRVTDLKWMSKPHIYYVLYMDIYGKF